MPQLNPYLNFNGKTEEAFNFYKSVFGGEFVTVMRFKDVPAEAQQGELSEADANRIMHIALPIGKTNILMGSDSPENYGEVKHGNGHWISVSVDSKEEADKLFGGLSAGGIVMMPMGDMFWGDYFGMFSDKYGISWMISYAANRK